MIEKYIFGFEVCEESCPNPIQSNPQYLSGPIKRCQRGLACLFHQATLLNLESTPQFLELRWLNIYHSIDLFWICFPLSIRDGQG